MPVVTKLNKKGKNEYHKTAIANTGRYRSSALGGNRFVNFLKVDKSYREAD